MSSSIGGVRALFKRSPTSLSAKLMPEKAAFMAKASLDYQEQMDERADMFVERFFDMKDPNQDGLITLEEMLSQGGDTEEDLKFFHQFDTNDDNRVSKAELKVAVIEQMKKEGVYSLLSLHKREAASSGFWAQEDVLSRQVDYLFSYMDADGDDRLTLEEVRQTEDMDKIEAFFRDIDTNNDRVLTKQEVYDFYY
jgi:Ca2+-binding EF-hand superfamily protein